MKFNSYVEYQEYTMAFNQGIMESLKPEAVKLKNSICNKLNGKFVQRGLRKARSLKFLSYAESGWYLVSQHSGEQVNSPLTLSGVKRLLGDYFDWLNVYPPEVITVVYNLWLLDDMLDSLKYFKETGDLVNPTFSILLLKENQRVLADCLYNAMVNRSVAASKTKLGIKVGMDLFSYEISSVPVYDGLTWEKVEVTNQHLGLLCSFARLEISPPILHVRVL